jgi:hypothetical protein
MAEPIQESLMRSKLLLVPLFGSELTAFGVPSMDGILEAETIRTADE